MGLRVNIPLGVRWGFGKEFEFPAGEKGRQIWMEFRGIKSRAEIWMNGKKVAGPDEVVGAFRRYDFNVTQLVRIGAKNAVAVSVSAPKAGELGIAWVDWNPAPPDKDMGLWQEVVLSTSGPVKLGHPFVETKIDLPKAELAHLTIRAFASNATTEPVTGAPRGTTSAARPST